MDVVAVIAQKGGAGKTTLALCLAVAAMRAGRSVVVVDLDLQASAAGWADRRGEATPMVVPAQPSRLELVLELAEGMGAEIAFLDTPKADSSALAAARLADLVLVPCRVRVTDTETVPLALDVIRLAGTPALGVLNAVPNRGNAEAKAKARLEAMGLVVSPAVLSAREVFGQSIDLGKTPHELQPKGKAAAEIDAVYQQVRAQLDILEGGGS